MRLPGKTLFKAPKPAAREPAPVIPEPVLAPDPDDEALKMAARRKHAARSKQSGFQSTQNTATRTDSLGGGGLGGPA